MLDAQALAGPAKALGDVALPVIGEHPNDPDAEVPVIADQPRRSSTR